MEQNQEKQLILSENLWKVCIQLSLPAVIAMVLFGLNVVFDAFFVGRYVGNDALAGISIVYPLTQIPLGIGSLIGVGAGSYLSILIGEDNKEIQRRLVGASNVCILLFSAITMILGLVFMNPLLHTMGATGDILQYAKEYYIISLIGMPLSIGGIGYNMIIRAEGKMKLAAIIMGIGLLVNVCANYVFMVIFSYGVAGAAWGTNLGMFIYIVLFFVYCGSKKASFETNEYRLYFDKPLIKEIISLGMPSFIMSIMTVIQGGIIMKVLNSYGTGADVAFYGVVFRLFNLFLTPIYGLMRALQPVVGVNYGAKQYERTIQAYKIFSIVAFIFMLPLWGVSILMPQTVLGFMLPNTSFSIENIHYFQIFITVAPLLCVVLTAMTFYPAIKKPKPAMLVGMGRQVFLYIPLMILLPKIMGIGGIYIGSFGIDAFLTIIIVLMLRKDFKELRKMEDMR